MPNTEFTIEKIPPAQELIVSKVFFAISCALKLELDSLSCADGRNFIISDLMISNIAGICPIKVDTDFDTCGMINFIIKKKSENTTIKARTIDKPLFIFFINLLLSLSRILVSIDVTIILSINAMTQPSIIGLKIPISLDR